MFSRKKQIAKPVTRLEVDLSDNNGRHYTKKFDIPNGCKVCPKGYSSDLVIRDADGDVKKTIYFQAGFTITVDYIY